MLIVKRFSFLKGFKHIVKFMDLYRENFHCTKTKNQFLVSIVHTVESLEFIITQFL